MLKTKNRLIPAYQIIEQVSGRRYLEEYVNDILSVINDDIQDTINDPDQKTHSVTQLQTNFDVPCMDNKRAQMYIYFHILKALTKLDYKPKIKMSGKGRDQKVFIYVRWLTKENLILEKHMNQYIQKHIIK